MSVIFNPADNPVMFAPPEWLTHISSWHEHIPFAMFLVSSLKPEVITELGVMNGDSFCSFCQTVKSLNLNSRCYGVDTWHGDQHAGYYQANDTLSVLRQHHDPRYGGFSKLMQNTFDEALHHFADGSIDLLHIDGLHTYEAVKHDFETWLPKVSQRGIVLFHDTNVRERDFGVHKLWAEISARYPHFEFLHGYGLGVLGVGKDVPQALLPFFNASPDEVTRLRQVFHNLGSRLANEDAEKKRLNELVTDKDRQIQKLENDIGQKEQHIHMLEAERVQLEAERVKLEAERVKLENAVRTTEQSLIAFTESRAGKLTQLLWKIRSAISFRA